MQARTIDWEAIHGRLADTATAISGGIDHGPEETRRILETRARAAARPPADTDSTERLWLVAFSLAGERYGVETRFVREVCQLKDLTAVPCTPIFVAGVMNLHGRIIAVIDLRKLFDLPVKELIEINWLIVLAGGDNELGLMVDGLEGVRSEPASLLQEGLPTLTGVRERFLKGVTGRMLAVLDGDRLLADADLKVNEQVAR